MMTKHNSEDNGTFQKITLPDEDIPKSRLRLFVTVIVTIFIAIMVFIDQFSGFWLLWVYWLHFSLGLLGNMVILWILLRWNERHLMEGEDTFLQKWGDEIGWPLMILAFTIQFLIPQIRPILLGAIFGGSWFLVWWNQRK